jgi:PspC domain.
MNKLRAIVEMQAFGVCTSIGEILGVATSRIRMWFIYISFLTMGSPLIVYMVLAFTLKLKQYIIAAKRNPIRYL